MFPKGFDYFEKFSRFGDSFASVGWSDERGQFFRFKQFCYFIEPESSVLDVGAGLGHFQEYLEKKNLFVKYLGIEKVSFFVEKARQLGRNVVEADFFDFEGEFDYVVASGCFSTHESPNLIDSIPKLFSLAKKGVCINFFTRTKFHDSLRTYNKNLVLKTFEDNGFIIQSIQNSYVKGEKMLFAKK